MPALSLVLCVCNERALLERLLQKADGCYDDLVVIHDGEDKNGISSVVQGARGRFFERPRKFQQEPHWPFAWQQAAHDWILRLDADEFPGESLRKWLQEFRSAPEPPADVSGYTCIWPVWNGNRALTKNWPGGRIFLFHRQRVRFIGIPEQTPIPDGRFVPLSMVLHHQPRRKSHSLFNVLVRKQAYAWRNQIAHSLLGKPTDLSCWRWESETWPEGWEVVRRHPLSTGVKRLVRGTLQTLRDLWKSERRIFPLLAIIGPLHHLLFCIKAWQVRRQSRSHRSGDATSKPSS